MRFRRRDAGAWFEQHAKAFQDRNAGRIEADKWWNRRVQATWGLIGRRDEAVPFATRMLQSRNPDIREDGAGILAALGRDEKTVDAVLSALRVETEHEPRDAMIAALGSWKDRRAIPLLAEVVRDETADGDTRWGAAEALGRIAGSRFHKESDPIAAAARWLEAEGF
jgi:HEAT repeats